MSRRKRRRPPLCQQLRHRQGLHHQLHREARHVVAVQVVTEEDEAEVVGLVVRHEEVPAAVVVPAADRERDKAGEVEGVESVAGQLEQELQVERQTALRARLRHQLQPRSKRRRKRSRTERDLSTETQRGGR